MSKFILLALLFSISTPIYAQDLPALLALKSGSKLPPKFDPQGMTKAYSYEIEKENKLIKSITIDFNQPVDASTYIAPKTEGFCLVQSQGHVKINRFFFFDMKTQRRYELTIMKQLKSILIQDMPGAKEHKPCTFESFQPKEEK